MLSDRYADGSYAQSHPGWHSDRAPWKASQIARLLEQGGVQPESLVDFGCGTGLCLHHLAGRYQIRSRSLGIEPSPDAPFFDSPELTLKRGHLEDIDREYDVLLMLDVFEHVEDYLGLLAKTRGKARWYAFHIPLDIYVLRIMAGRLLTSRKAHGHLHYFTFETALATLQEVGFEPVHWRFTPSSFDGPNRGRWKPLSLCRRLLYQASPALTARWLGGVSLAVLARDGDGPAKSKTARESFVSAH